MSEPKKQPKKPECGCDALHCWGWQATVDRLKAEVRFLTEQLEKKK